jgi:hypothetical protein
MTIEQARHELDFDRRVAVSVTESTRLSDDLRFGLLQWAQDSDSDFPRWAKELRALVACPDEVIACYFAGRYLALNGLCQSGQKIDVNAKMVAEVTGLPVPIVVVALQMAAGCGAVYRKDLNG